jgi:hypothetical protein
MDVRLRYFDGCPSWETTYTWLREVLNELGLSGVEPVLERVETPEEAQRLHFVGSPTVLIDGRDPFAGSSCAKPSLPPNDDRCPEPRGSRSAVTTRGSFRAGAPW